MYNQSYHNTVQSSFQNLYVLDYHYFVKLLIFRQGIVYERTIFISFSSWYWIDTIRQCAVEAGKEFPYLVIGEEGHVNNCQIL